MTDRTQFEAMLEALINEDQETAKEIFHNIVVAKSREIYEELLDSDFNLKEGENPFAKDSEEEPEDDAEADEADDADSEEGDVGGDATDDFIDDVESDDGEEDDMSGDEGEEGDVETRVMDLEDALEELKAEFEQLMAGEEDEPDMGADDMGMDAEPEMDGGMDDMDMGAPEEQDEMAKFMEYVDKVALPKHGDNGTNARSIVAGKNDMGGTTSNIARGGVEHGVEANKGQLKGNGVFKGSKPTLQDGGNVNVPGANAGKSAFKKKEPGHGPEKKGSGDTAPDKKSLIGSRK